MSTAELGTNHQSPGLASGASVSTLSNTPVAPEMVQDGPSTSARWIRRAIAVLTTIVLGFCIAASAVPTGHATAHTVTAVPDTRTVEAGVPQPTAFDAPAQNRRGSVRSQLSPSALEDLARDRSSALFSAGLATAVAGQQPAVVHRQQTLAVTNSSIRTRARALRRQAEELKKKKAAEALKKKKKAAEAASRSCLPLSTYRVAARFGDVGIWARYHTGIDFAAPIGTAIHAPRAGVVTHAGPGSAAPWAGNYVTIRYPDGTQSLMAHMSLITVRLGQAVDPCQLVGAVGMTGRTFGPHLHFEIYPAGVEPGDIYRAVNPAPWLNMLRHS